jgi:hypothetical protein
MFQGWRRELQIPLGGFDSYAARMSRFQDFDFNHPAFKAHSQSSQEFLRRAYKSGMSHSQFIEEFIAARTKFRSSKTSSDTMHQAYKAYERLDEKFNFFGNYEE